MFRNEKNKIMQLNVPSAIERTLNIVSLSSSLTPSFQHQLDEHYTPPSDFPNRVQSTLSVPDVLLEGERKERHVKEVHNI